MPVGRYEIDLDADYEASIVDGKLKLAWSKQNGIVSSNYQVMDDLEKAQYLAYLQGEIANRTNQLSAIGDVITKLHSVVDTINNATIA